MTASVTAGRVAHATPEAPRAASYTTTRDTADRIHRIGQTRPVTVHVPMAIHAGYREHSFDCLLHSLMARKRKLASSALWPMGDTASDAADLQERLNSAQGSQSGHALVDALTAMFLRDGSGHPMFDVDGSVSYG